MRPYVIINFAMSADGKISLKSSPLKISCEEDSARVHRLRNSCDAILVGINTVLKDDPHLTVKKKYVEKIRNPIRVILDTKGRIPENARVLDKDASTIVVVGEKCNRDIKNAEIIKCGVDKIDIKKLMKILYKKGIRKILVEGGMKVILEFLKKGLVDEMNVYIGSIVIGGAKKENEIMNLQLKSYRKIGNGVLLRYGVKK